MAIWESTKLFALRRGNFTVTFRGSREKVEKVGGVAYLFFGT